jgi:hypothetical protein
LWDSNLTRKNKRIFFPKKVSNGGKEEEKGGDVEVDLLGVEERWNFSTERDAAAHSI